MSFFSYQDGVLHAEQLALPAIAGQIGTPCYVYSRAAIEKQWRELDQAFGAHAHLICYAVKANSNLAVLNILARLGSGFDIVSAGELRRVILAGGDPAKVVFSGVAKSHDELAYVINNDIRCINVESVAELKRVQQVAGELDKTARIALRVNPDVDAQTHPYIATGMENAKFGIAMDAAYDTYVLADEMANIQVHSIACHIGSQITQLEPFNDAVERVAELVVALAERGIHIAQLDLGGGLGINYQGEQLPSADQYVNTLINAVKRHGLDLPIAIEPGRYVVGNAGVLLTRVEYLKHGRSKSFAVVDAGMNDLLRPSLYQAWHNIVNVEQESNGHSGVYDVVGPVCESADVLGYERSLKLADGDLLAVKSTGAYAFVMASNYNSRPRPAEIMVDGDQMHIIRRRETVEELTQGEAILP